MSTYYVDDIRGRLMVFTHRKETDMEATTSLLIVGTITLILSMLSDDDTTSTVLRIMSALEFLFAFVITALGAVLA